MNYCNNDIDYKLLKPGKRLTDVILFIVVILILLSLSFYTGYTRGYSSGTQTIQQQWDEAELDRQMCPCDTLDVTGREFWSE